MLFLYRIPFLFSFSFVFLMTLRPPSSTRTYTLFPSPTLFRSRTFRFVWNDNVAIDGKATGEHGLFCPGKTYIASPENIIGVRRLWPAHSRGLYRIKIGAERINIVALCL